MLEDLQSIPYLAHQKNETYCPISPLHNTITHQACHHPTPLRLLKVVSMRCSTKRCVFIVHPKKLRLRFLHVMFYHQEAPVLAATQCNAVNCRRVAAAQRIQTRCQPSQKGAEESQREARRTQRGQDREQRGFRPTIKDWTAGVYRLRDGRVFAREVNMTRSCLKPADKIAFANNLFYLVSHPGRGWRWKILQ